MKRIISFMLILLVFSSYSYAVEIKNVEFDFDAKSVILMDANTGTILYSKNEHIPLPPASVTKIMTLLLVFEAIERAELSYSDILSVSEYASSMGGSQIFLEPGEEMSVEDLLKSVVVASANDAAVTLAEHVAGSEEAFVQRMNARASELGMKNTNFENVTGLDDDTQNHITSAYDIALMSRELLKHKKITDYSKIWMDTIRNGEFGLSNTNRLVRYYKGITGLKTGYTTSAGYCVSATAERNGLCLIAVIMGAETSQIRNNIATKLLDFGFANYSIFKDSEASCGKIKVLCGENDYVEVGFSGAEELVNKGSEEKINKEIVLEKEVKAPIYENDVVGKVIYKLDDKIIAEKEILAKENIEKLSVFDYIFKIISKIA